MAVRKGRGMAKGDRYLFSSECVFPGHPDKVADQISDAILDAHLTADPAARVACETLVGPQLVVVAGEITSNAAVDAEKVAREAVRAAGYDDPELGFDAKNARVIVHISAQSPDIAKGVDEDPAKAKDQGAGDQGMMFGFATDETPERMPLAITLARRLSRRHGELRRSREIPYFRPDGKCQVTVEYEDGRPRRVHTVVFSSQTAPGVPIQKIREDVIEKIAKVAIPKELLDGDTVYHVNPTGVFEKGGPAADTGLTGRKIIVDTYGGSAPHGGGAFSGKDPSKVDRSAAYAARWVAKNIVAAGLARQVLVQVAYAIGVARPVSVHVDCGGTSKVPQPRIGEAVAKVFDLRPKAIIERLNLRRPIYRAIARDGHFGLDGESYTWEKTDMAEALKKAVGK